jgi:mono/diheme cytochrome c family protein
MVACGAQAAEPLDGQALFKQKCTACHTADKVLSGVRKIEPPQRDARLQKFLAAHNAPDPGQRAAIVSYLLSEAAK